MASPDTIIKYEYCIVNIFDKENYVSLRLRRYEASSQDKKIRLKGQPGPFREFCTLRVPRRSARSRSTRISGFEMLISR